MKLGRARLTRWALGLALIGLTRPASAAGPLGPEGTPITTSAYRVDLTQGPVLAGTRVLGLAGAYVAIAEGTDGMSQNPAAPAVRSAYSFDSLDYDLGFGLTFPAAVKGNDFFNSGRDTNVSREQTDFLFLNLSALLQLGRWGMGISADFQQFQLASRGQSLGLHARFGGLRLQVARAFADGQLVLGMGSRGTGMLVENENPGPGQPKELFAIEGAALELGALWRPNWQPFRAGVAVRSAVFTTDLRSEVPKNAAGDRVVLAGPDTIYLPNQVALPWDVSVGIAAQLGPRPFNPRWVDPEAALGRLERHLRWRELERERRRRHLVARAVAAGSAPAAAEQAADAELATEAGLDALHRERAERRLRERLVQRYRETKRFYLLVSSSLLITGPVKNAVGVESFLQGEVQRSGQSVTYSPRLGLESEIVPDWMTARVGTYGEPTRFESPGARARLHGTMGFDLKLFPWTVFGLFDDGTHWRVAAAIDGAKNYFSWGASIGVWH